MIKWVERICKFSLSGERKQKAKSSLLKAGRNCHCLQTRREQTGFVHSQLRTRFRCLPGEEVISLVFRMKSCCRHSVLRRNKIVRFWNLIPDWERLKTTMPRMAVWCLFFGALGFYWWESVIPTLIHLFNKYLLSTYCIPDTVPGMKQSCYF